MATSEQIAQLRRLINQPVNEAPYTDAVLTILIDAQTDGNLNTVAGSIWTEKAATYAELVDVQEGSSRRALGDLYEQAIAMALHYSSVDGDGSIITVRHARTRPIVRP